MFLVSCGLCGSWFQLSKNLTTRYTNHTKKKHETRKGRTQLAKRDIKTGSQFILFAGVGID